MNTAAPAAPKLPMPAETGYRMQSQPSPSCSIGLAAAALLCATPVKAAETEISVYSGWQTAPDSVATFSGHPDQPDGAVTMGWLGRSFHGSPYYGLRATRWTSSGTGWGWGADFVHAKAYADDATLDATAFDHLEMTDGHNILTATLFYRWNEGASRWTPYLGGGLGVAFPHFEAISDNDRSWGYQLTGPAVLVVAGVSYRLNERWSVFGEYAGTYSINRMRFDSGATMQTNLITNAVNFGIGYRF